MLNFSFSCFQSMYIFAARLISNSNKTKFPTKPQYIEKCFEVVCCKPKSIVQLLTACIEHDIAGFPTSNLPINWRTKADRNNHFNSIAISIIQPTDRACMSQYLFCQFSLKKKRISTLLSYSRLLFCTHGSLFMANAFIL